MNFIPIQRSTTSHPTFVLTTPTPPSIVQQLQRQNQLLKNQLASLMKLTPQAQHHPKSVPNNQSAFVRTCPLSGDGQDVESSFKRKMSKLRNKKSNRNSIDKTIYSQPCSPTHTPLHQQQYKPAQHNHIKTQQDQSFKMVIEKDGSGRFYRNKSKEHSQPALEKGLYSPRYYIAGEVPRLQFTPFPNENQVQFLPPKSVGHKRHQSSLSHTKQNSTTRKFIQRCHQAIQVANNAFSKKQTQKGMTPLDQIRQGPDSHQLSFPSPQRVVPPSHKYILSEAKQNLRPCLSPRGQVYIDDDTAERTQKCQTPEQTQYIEGDSMVSIEKGLRTNKTVRKLRCDIYMSQDK